MGINIKSIFSKAEPYMTTPAKQAKLGDVVLDFFRALPGVQQVLGTVLTIKKTADLAKTYFGVEANEVKEARKELKAAKDAYERIEKSTIERQGLADLQSFKNTLAAIDATNASTNLPMDEREEELVNLRSELDKLYSEVQEKEEDLLAQENYLERKRQAIKGEIGKNAISAVPFLGTGASAYNFVRDARNYSANRKEAAARKDFFDGEGVKEFENPLFYR